MRKTVNRAIALTILGLATVQAAQAWKSTLLCGACIDSGFNFCIQADEGLLISLTATTTTTFTCCQDDTVANCPQVAQLGYTCSSSYADVVMKKGVCPYNKKYCGNSASSTNEFTLTGSETGSTAVSLSVSALVPGEVCFYRIRNKCGAPKITVLSGSGGTIQRIDYIDSDDIDLSLQAQISVSVGSGRLLYEDVEQEEEEDIQDIGFETDTLRYLKGSNSRMTFTANSATTKTSNGTSTNKPRNTQTTSSGSATTSASVVVDTCLLSDPSGCSRFNQGNKLQSGEPTCGSGKVSAIVITNTQVQTSRRNLDNVNTQMSAQGDTLSNAAQALLTGTMALMGLFVVMA